MSQHVIELDPRDYEYLQNGARALGMSVQAFLKRLIDRERLDESSTSKAGHTSRWARFSEDIKKDPPLRGAGDLVRHYARELREDFAITSDDLDDGESPSA